MAWNTKSVSMADTTLDTILGGRLRLIQPARGHRAGTDAVLVAAAVPAKSGDVIADFGAGVGTAGLAVLVRVHGTRAVLIEIDPQTADLAKQNSLANDLDAEVMILDVATAGKGTSAALAASADHVVSNPPFNAASGRPSPDAVTARARVAQDGQLDEWVHAAARVLKPGGSLTLIHRPEALHEILAAFRNRFGEVTLRFIYPEPGAPAMRILVRARKDSRAPLRVLAPFVVNLPRGGFTPETEAVHRDLAALDMG
jgi:tRNA1(Val) A37 N6-methylase TrmN6